MDTHTRQLIEKTWNLKILSVTDAPRQFVATTYVLDTEKGKIFCKIIDKKIFIPGVIVSLPSLVEMHSLGIDHINYPIPTVADELYILADQTLIVLFNYIEGTQTENYDHTLFGKQIAEIHQISGRMNTSTPRETFVYKHADMFCDRLMTLSNLQDSTQTEQVASRLLKQNFDRLMTLYKIFEDMSRICQAKNWEMVLTHGDAAGNVLVNSEEIYIVDWDDILLAPAERDLWSMSHSPDFLQGYQSVRANFVPTQVALRYYLLSRFFNDLVEYWAEIFEDASETHKQSHFLKMKRGLFEEDGWLYSRIKTIV